MIVKRCQSIGQLNFSHVALRTIIILNRTSWSSGPTLRRGHYTFNFVARQAFEIVSGNVRDQIFMRIVASDAADPRIGSAEALAAGQSVGLEAHGEFATPRPSNYLCDSHGFRISPRKPEKSPPLRVTSIKW